jgi:hypothetical protein
MTDARLKAWIENPFLVRFPNAKHASRADNRAFFEDFWRRRTKWEDSQYLSPFEVRVQGLHFILGLIADECKK